MSDDIDTLIAAFEARSHGTPGYALGLVGLAELVAKKKHPHRARDLARAGLAAADGDPRVLARGRALLSNLIQGYHVPMMNDARRNAAWDRALRRAIRPGMHVFEIGTGAGMLALMAARAGADRVVTCERNPVVAGMARELVSHNGYADQIDVVEERSQHLIIGRHMAHRADLLFCDIFADDLFDFEPLAAIADAKARLLAPGAPIMPAAVSLHVALANWSQYARELRLDTACGFDFAPLRDFAPSPRHVPIGDPGMALLSGARRHLHFDFAQPLPAVSGAATTTCEVTRDGEVNGIARWIRLDLDDETSLEARPEPGAEFFSRMVFIPLAEPLAVRAGERYRVESVYAGNRIDTWLAGG